MNVQLQRGGVWQRQPERARIWTLLAWLGVPDECYCTSRDRWCQKGAFYETNAGRLEEILYEANRAWRRKVKEIGDTTLCREVNDVWNRVKRLIRQAMHPKLVY